MNLLTCTCGHQYVSENGAYCPECGSRGLRGARALTTAEARAYREPEEERPSAPVQDEPSVLVHPDIPDAEEPDPVLDDFGDPHFLATPPDLLQFYLSDSGAAAATETCWATVRTSPVFTLPDARKSLERVQGTAWALPIRG